jgi:hypothetical protein
MIRPPPPTSATISQQSVRINKDSVPSQKHVTEPEQVYGNNISKVSDVGEFVKVLKMRLVKGPIQY